MLTRQNYSFVTP